MGMLSDLERIWDEHLKLFFTTCFFNVSAVCIAWDQDDQRGKVELRLRLSDCPLKGHLFCQNTFS